MAEKKVAYCGVITAVPMYEASNTSKTVTKDHGGGCTSKFTETHKAGGFVDKRSGNQGFKQEVKYNSSYKVNDKIQGSTTEYQTQVKCSKTTTFHGGKHGSGGGGRGGGGGGGRSGGSKGSGSKYVDYY